MNEKDVVNLYQSLARCRDGFMQTRSRHDKSQPVPRMSKRDRELRLTLMKSRRSSGKQRRSNWRNAVI